MPVPANRRRTASATSTTGPHVRVCAELRRREDEHERCVCRERIGDGVAEQREVGRIRGRQRSDITVRRGKRRRTRRNRLVADRRRLRVPRDLESRDPLDPRSIGLGHERVLAGLRKREVGDVDTRHSTGCGLGLPGDADGVERRLGRDDRRCVERRADPHVRARPLDRPRLRVDHQEGDPDTPGRVVGRALDQGDIRAGRASSAPRVPSVVPVAVLPPPQAAAPSAAANTTTRRARRTPRV